MRRIDHIVLHCSATRPKDRTTLADITRWHTDPKPTGRGWPHVGYHFFIPRTGGVQRALPIERPGIHVANHNAHTIGICLEGGLSNATGEPEDNFTGAQWSSLEALAHELVAMFPQATILGHRDLSPDKNGDGLIGPNEWLKACPCFDARTWARNHDLPPAPTQLGRALAAFDTGRVQIATASSSGTGAIGAEGGAQVIQSNDANFGEYLGELKWMVTDLTVTGLRIVAIVLAAITVATILYATGKQLVRVWRWARGTSRPIEDRNEYDGENA